MPSPKTNASPSTNPPPKRSTSPRTSASRKSNESPTTVTPPSETRRRSERVVEAPVIQESLRTHQAEQRLRSREQKGKRHRPVVSEDSDESSNLDVPEEWYKGPVKSSRKENAGETEREIGDDGPDETEIEEKRDNPPTPTTTSHRHPHFRSIALHKTHAVCHSAETPPDMLWLLHHRPDRADLMDAIAAAGEFIHERTLAKALSPAIGALVETYRGVYGAATKERVRLLAMRVEVLYVVFLGAVEAAAEVGRGVPA